MTIEQLNRDMGRIEGDVRAMDRRVQDMQMKVDEVHRAITEARGGWKTMVAVGSLSAAITTFFLKVAGFFKGGELP